MTVCMYLRYYDVVVGKMSLC